MKDIEVHFEDSSLVDQVVPESVSKRFGWDSPEDVKAVDGVSLDIEENDVVALVGESGCGKTTLGKTAIGLQRPTAGNVEYRGQDIWELRDGEAKNTDLTWTDVRTALQIIHQDPGSSLNPNRTVQGNLAEPLKKHQSELNANDRRSRILSLLEYVGMTPAEDYSKRYPHQLSGGEKQRVALIRALLMEPDLILADEAVSALDVSLRIGMMDLMLELQDIFDTSFIFISHNLSNARYLVGQTGGRIAVMYLGNIVEIGTAEQIINDPQHPYTKVLRWATPILRADEAAKMMEEKPPIRELDVPDASNPPSVCRFHTRFPEALEMCA
jgi:peptide/nickel transport system ATP-binding protein